MAELLVIVPSRGRPHVIADLWHCWQATTTGHADMLLCLDEDDPTLPDYRAVIASLDDLGGLQVRFGERLRLAGTLNAAAAEHVERYPLLGFWGDDNRPRTHGWDKRLVDELHQLGSGVVYGNDLLQREKMPTAVALTSDIVQRLGYMCPPGFVHLCLDLVWLEWGRGMGAISYLDDVVIEHLHPANGKAPWDETYADCNSPERNTSDSARFYDYRDNDLAADLDKLADLLVRVDIGGGHTPQPGYRNLDPVHGTGEWRRRIQDGIPLPDASAHAVRASHVLEHIPTEHRIAAMNEIHRVLRPGGRFEVILPLFPSWQAMADPTHVSYWVPESFDYFTGAKFAQADYGIRLWNMESWEVRDGWEAHAILTPASPR